MDDELAKDASKIQADNQSIAIGEINITGTVTGNITIGHTIVQPADAGLRHDLGILLKNVQTTWIKGVLEKSVHEAALLELGLEIREEAVDNPWRMVIESPDQSRQTLPRGRRIKDIFDEANRLLLILGEPGSGKTTTLLQLARDLIAEVDSAFTQPVPVILNLSTWTNKAQPLDEWLVAELNSKYRLPKKDGQRWLKERRILPLLDGLDEVRSENRAACVERINQLVVDYGMQGLIVCSRIKDYTALDVRLAFYRAIYIQPLTSEQVAEYLARASDKLASLRAVLQRDEALRSMAQSPLILNIMSLAYQNTSAEDLGDPALDTDKARRNHLFDTYIVRMLIRKVGAHEYENEKTKHRLSWLARNMQKHNQEVFLIEGLQPNWLGVRHWQWIYTLVSRLTDGLIVGAIFLLFLIGGVFHKWPSEMKFIGSVITIGAVTGLPLGCIDILRFEWLRKQTGLIRKSAIFWWSVGNVIVVGLTFWMIVGLGFGMITELIAGQSKQIQPWLQEDPYYGFVYGLGFGAIFGLIFGLRGSKQNLDQDIQTVEALRWSWRKALIGGLIGAIGGLIYGLLFALMTWMQFRRTMGLQDQQFFWLIGGLIGIILNGLHHEIIETKTRPNQGISLSIRNAIYGGWIVMLSTILSYGLLLKLAGTGDSLIRVLLIIKLTLGLMLMVGFIGALWYGIFDVIQHYILRLILVIQGHTPANYARFLDYAVDRIFLQKVGGGYRFIHRLLLEHFAEMDETKKL